MSAAALADLIVAIHVGYVSFVVVGLVLIWLGHWIGWHWIGNRWFRSLHLIAILIVAGEAVGGIACPLTVWEEKLRQQSAQPITGDTFVGRLLHGLIFFDLSPATFTIIYVAFAAVIGLSILAVPVRWRGKNEARIIKKAHE
ncbi:MAG: DUF2784 domain-containing protein [Gemmataceae bacterium]